METQSFSSQPADFEFLKNKFPHLTSFFDEENKILNGENYSHIEIKVWAENGDSLTIGRFASNKTTFIFPLVKAIV